MVLVEVRIMDRVRDEVLDRFSLKLGYRFRDMVRG